MDRELTHGSNLNCEVHQKLPEPNCLTAWADALYTAQAVGTANTECSLLVQVMRPPLRMNT